LFQPQSLPKNYTAAFADIEILMAERAEKDLLEEGS
jgi:hypothetical protein